MNDLQLLGKTLAKTALCYFEDPLNRKGFEEWYERKYGQKYFWKVRSYEKDEQKEREQVREAAV